MNIEVFSDGSELWDDIASGKNKDGAGKFYGKLNNIEKQLVDSKIFSEFFQLLGWIGELF